MNLEAAIERLHRELPGWWFTVGVCSVSADATVGPDRNGQDAYLLEYRYFDEGISNDLSPPATAVDALNGAIDKALNLKALHLAGRMHMIKNETGAIPEPDRPAIEASDTVICETPNGYAVDVLRRWIESRYLEENENWPSFIRPSDGELSDLVAKILGCGEKYEYDKGLGLSIRL